MSEGGPVERILALADEYAEAREDVIDRERVGTRVEIDGARDYVPVARAALLAEVTALAETDPRGWYEVVWCEIDEGETQLGAFPSEEGADALAGRLRPSTEEQARGHGFVAVRPLIAHDEPGPSAKWRVYGSDEAYAVMPTGGEDFWPGDESTPWAGPTVEVYAPSAAEAIARFEAYRAALTHQTGVAE